MSVTQETYTATRTATEQPLRQKPVRVTVNDIAQRAGVQQASVSVVLNGAKSNTHVSAAVRERIIAVAEELGYKRNGSMASVRTGRFGSVALLQSTHGSVSRVSQQLWTGISDSLTMRDLHLSVFRLPDEDLTDETHLPKILREWMADGMLIDYTHAIPPRLKALVDTYSLPAIWINSQQEFDCVHPDDYKAAVDATEALIGLGHKKIAYVNLYHDPESVAHYSLTARHQGYLAAMEHAGLEPQSWIDFGVEPRDRVAKITSIMQERMGTFTALVTSDSRNAGPAIWAAERVGLKIPDQLSVINVGIEVDSMVPFFVTTYGLPEYTVGTRAVELLLKKIENPSIRLSAQAIPFPYLNGGTVVEFIGK